MPRQYKNPGPIIFRATIQRDTSISNSSAWIEFPFDLKETFGVGNLVPFKATFDGRVKYQGSLAKMGGPSAMLLLRKDVRTELGKQPGDEVDVVVVLDDAPRKIVVPDDVRKALADVSLLKLFEGLAFTHRREYVEWVEDAKRPETRERRIAKMCEMLTLGKKGLS